MSFNLFDKTYVAPDYMYDADVDRVIFSAYRNQAEYIDYRSLNSVGFGTEVKLSTASIDDVVGTDEDQSPSVAHYLRDLYRNRFSGKIFADHYSYMKLFFAWLHIAMPNHTADSAFTVYNLIKQREALVFPDNANNRTFVAPRLNARTTNTVLTKTEFTEALAEFNSNDTVSAQEYADINAEVRSNLCIEIQLASYLSGNTDISIVTEKTNKILQKIIYANIDDIRQYIRDNIQTDKVRTMTGVEIGYDEQDWESKLRAASDEMDFLFRSDQETVVANSEYRESHTSQMLWWCQWLVDNTIETDAVDMHLSDVLSASKYISAHGGILSDDVSVRQAECLNILEFDIAQQGTTVIYDQEYLRDRINAFWIAYVYELSENNDTDTLAKLSHT